jgi:septum formation protein
MGDLVLADLVLASASPRRRDLLARLGLDFRVVPADVDERPHPDETPEVLVRRLAETKAAAVDGDPVLAADTVVEIDGIVLGKPVDAADARRMLSLLSGRTHRVCTGVAVRTGAGQEVAVITTEVRFVALDDAAIEWYLATGEPFDKAGAYAIQGAAGAFVDSVHGSVSNVVGLPLATVTAMLGRLAGWSLGGGVTGQGPGGRDERSGDR